MKKAVPWILVAAAMLLCTAILCDGIAGPFTAGHWGFHGGEYSTRARHTLRHGALLPSNTPGFEAPRPESYYLHHPILTHQLVTLTLLVLGDHEYAVRAASAIGLLLCQLLLALVMARLYSPWHAAAAAYVFVLVPINIWFGFHIDPGYPSIACLLGFFLFYDRWGDGAKTRDAVVALGFMALAGGFEWSPYLAAVPLFGYLAVVGLRQRGRHLKFAVAYVGAVLAPIVFHFFCIWSSGHLADMRESLSTRTKAQDQGSLWHSVWENSKQLFGAWLLYLIALWLIVLVVRLVRRQGRARDLVAATFLIAVLLYARIFGQVVMIHAYRLLYAGVVGAIAVADLAGLVVQATAALGARWAALRPIVVAVVAAAVIALPINGARVAVADSRARQGNPGFGKYDPILGQAVFARAVTRATAPTDHIEVHSSIVLRMDVAYYIDRVAPSLLSLRSLLTVPKGTREASLFGSYGRSTLDNWDFSHSVVIVTPRALGGGEREAFVALARQHPLYEVDGRAFVDLRKSGPEVHVDALRPTTLSGWQRYFVGPYPLPSLHEDQAAEAAYWVELGLSPIGSVPELPFPSGSALPPLLTYYNYAVLRGSNDGERVLARLRDRVTLAGPSNAAADGHLVSVLWDADGTLHTLFQMGPVAPRAPVSIRVTARPIPDGKPPGPPATQLFGVPLPAAGFHSGFLYEAAGKLALPPGKYELKVEIAPPNGPESEALLRGIVVR